MRRFFGFTWLGWSNLLLFQWFGLRLFVREHLLSGKYSQVGFICGVRPLSRWYFSKPSPDKEHTAVVILKRPISELCFALHGFSENRWRLTLPGWRPCFDVQNEKLKFHGDKLKAAEPVDCQD